MRQEMYSNIIGKEVWNKGKNLPIWLHDYLAKIDFKDCPFNRLDIAYDITLEPGEIRYVSVVYYSNIIGRPGEEHRYLVDMSLDEQKKIFDIFEKKLSEMLA